MPKEKPSVTHGGIRMATNPATVHDTTVEGKIAENQNVNTRINRLESSNFFKMSGMPKFDKQWLDNFISDIDLQNTFLTCEVVRNVIML